MQTSLKTFLLLFTLTLLLSGCYSLGWRFDECLYSGIADEVLDSGEEENLLGDPTPTNVHGYTATDNKPLPTTVPAQYCRGLDLAINQKAYAVIPDHDYLSPTTGSSSDMTVGIVFQATTLGNRSLLFKEGEYGLEINNNKVSLTLYNSTGTVLTSSTALASATYYLVVGHYEENYSWPSTTDRLTLTIYQLSGATWSEFDTTSTTFAGDNLNNTGSDLLIGKQGNQYFDGIIDEAFISDRLLTLSDIVAQSENGACPSCAVNVVHFAINHDGSGDPCQPEPITISRHDPLHVTDTTYTGTINLTTSTNHGDWSVITGNGTLTNSGNGVASYTYVASDNGQVILGLRNTFNETLNINVTDGVAQDVLPEDNDLIFTNMINETFRDEFNNRAYTNNDGTLAFSSPWLEVGESDGPTNGDVRVLNDQSRFNLRIQDNDNGGEGVEREADLSAFTAATLSLDYRRNNLDDASDYVALWISGDGGGSWTELDRFAGPGNDASYLAASYDITAYIAANTKVRLLSSPDLGQWDQVYFDNVQILASAPIVCAGVDHYALSHDGTGINCQPEPVTISAHDADHAVLTAHTGPIAITTSTGHGDWSVISGNPANLTNSGNGNASYTFDGSEAGVVVLGLKDTFVESININVTDGTATELTGNALVSEDLPIAFAASGFNFLANGAIDSIGNQIGGKPSDTAPGNQLLELEAIKTSDNTGQCEAALVGSNTIQLAFECLDPTSCTANLVNINGTSIAANDNGAVASYTGVALDFGDNTDTTATFIMSYADVGQLRLHAQFDIPLASGLASGNLMVGASNSFVVRPFGFDLFVPGNPGAAGPAGTIFTTAGTPFTANLRAVVWQAADDINNDGIPDNHTDLDPTNNADLTDNTAAVNFGQEIIAEDVSLSSLLYLPTGGTNPALAGATTVGAFTNGASTSNVRYDEVGIIELIANLTDNNYLSAGNATGSSGLIGRFTPERFAVSISPDPPSFSDACPLGGYSYLGEPFPFATNPLITITAFNAAPTPAVTKNYDCGGFWKFTTPMDLAYSYTDSSGNSLLISPSASTVSPSAADTSDCNGLVQLTISDAITYERPPIATPINPFAASVDLFIDKDQLTDSDTICYDTGLGCQDYSKNALTGTTLRHGKIQVFNNFGPETQDITNSPFEAQYFDGTSWITNTDDDCSTGLAFCSAPAADRVDPLTIQPDPLSQGQGSFTVTTSGSFGEKLDVCPIAPAWLTETDCTAPDTTCGEFTFGIYRGNDRIINWREIVR